MFGLLLYVLCLCLSLSVCLCLSVSVSVCLSLSTVGIPVVWATVHNVVVCIKEEEEDLGMVQKNRPKTGDGAKRTSRFLG